MAKQEEANLRLKVEFNIEDCDRGKLLRIAATGQVLLLNDSAAQLLRCLKEGHGRSQLVEDLVSRFDADPEIARDDVDRYLHELVNLGMLEDARY
ncbi:MAG: hypothetical protein ACI97A_000672 [Planctomycetota bacterium]|jgi:hypothetical protein